MQINNLLGQIRELEERLKRSIEYWKYDTPVWSYETNSINYLAIGNSLTIVGGKWNRGACSTKPNNDYFGIVSDSLKSLSSHVHECSVVAYRYNFNIWERSPERNKVLDLLDFYLSPAIDIISLQLGENVSQLDKTYEIDLQILVDYVRQAAPKAQIVIIDDFWDTNRSKVRQRVADKTNCLFADLASIRGKREYQSREGIVCYMIDGSMEYVTKNAETHPGDEGMHFIAESVLKQLRTHMNAKNGKK